MQLILKITTLFFVALLAFACNDDAATVTATYTEGTPIYGDIQAIRQTPLQGSPRDIVNPGKIFVAEDYLLIGEEEVGVHVIDNTDPQNPTPIAFINIPGNKEFYFEDDMIYAESYYDMLKIDLSDPLNPVLVHRVEEALNEEITNDKGQTLLGFEFQEVTRKISKEENLYDYIYGGLWHFALYDYTHNLIPPSAVPASFAGNSSGKIGSVNRIVEHKGYVYVVSRSNMLIFNNQANFEKIDAPWFGNDMETIYPMGDYLFIGGRNAVQIADITDPENPLRVSSFWHATSCDPVYPAENNRAYVTLRTGDFAECPGDINALVLLDISDIQQPREIQEVEMSSPFGVQKIGDLLYVGEGENGLKIFDVSDEDELRLLESVHTLQAYDVLEHPVNKDIILIAGPDGLNQYRLQNDFELLSELPF